VSLELTAVPLAFLAGVVGVLSPCVWPLVPVVVSSASVGGRRGAVGLAAGMSVSFALAGSILSWALVSLRLDPELFRHVAGALLLAAGAVLVVPGGKDRVTALLSGWIDGSSFGEAAREAGGGPGIASQLGVGALLGVVWLPCVGPTLGAAIGLASMGQSMGKAFLVMLAYGVGTAGVLLAAGLTSGKALRRWRPRLAAGGAFGLRLLGGSLLLVGLLVLTGADKTLEAMAVDLLPAWVYSI
jgi:cytochrome c biogenesis protein CcdA